MKTNDLIILILLILIAGTSLGSAIADYQEYKYQKERWETSYYPFGKLTHDDIPHNAVENLTDLQRKK